MTKKILIQREIQRTTQNIKQNNKISMYLQNNKSTSVKTED